MCLILRKKNQNDTRVFRSDGIPTLLVFGPIGCLWYVSQMTRWQKKTGSYLKSWLNHVKSYKLYIDPIFGYFCLLLKILSCNFQLKKYIPEQTRQAQTLRRWRIVRNRFVPRTRRFLKADFLAMFWTNIASAGNPRQQIKDAGVGKDCRGGYVYNMLTHMYIYIYVYIQLYIYIFTYRWNLCKCI